MTLPILISGAGPSGLTLALELARRNIPFEIFDKAPGPAPMAESRALAFNPRSQLILSASGVTEKIIAEGHPISKVQFSWDGEPLAQIALQLPTQPDKKIISLPQGKVERILLAALLEFGFKPQWNTELVAYQQTAHEVIAETVTGKNQTKRKGKYLAGCDGAHSVVRKQGNYSFEGQSDPQIWQMADILLDTKEYANTISVDFVAGGANATIAVNDRHMRIIRTGQDAIDNHPLMKRAEEVLWKSQFKVSYRMVNKFARERTYLCGDAAHIHSPVGGRGMNLGIEDAATLAFLLSENREAEYSDMRIPVARKVLKFTHTQTKQILSSSPFSTFAKRRILPLAVKIPMVRNSVLRTILALDTPEPEWI